MQEFQIEIKEELAKLAQPYLKANAQVLDPFCGVGTMLIERNKLAPANPMYGIDIFGEAIDKAMELYYDQKIILDAEDMKGVDFQPMQPEKKR